MTRLGHDPEQVARRYLQRDGAHLVAYREAGLPYFRINIQALVMEHKPLDAFSEFLLRSVAGGMDAADDAARILGLERAVLEPVVAALVSSNDLAPSRSDAGTTTLGLTAKGTATLEQLGMIQPTESWIEIDYDALLQTPTAPNRDLTQPDLLRGGRRATLVRPLASKPPESEDLDHNVVERMIQELAGGPARAKRTLLGFKPIERRKRRTMFLPAVMLIYRTADRSSVRVEFAVNGRISDSHGRAFARTKQRQRIEQEILSGPTPEDAARSLFAEDVVERARSSSAPELQQQIALASLLEEDGAIDEATRDAALEAEEKLSKEKFRFLETFEHRGVLADVLETARERVLIISPWIRRAVVDDGFIAKLDARLRAGVKAYIGWGISDEEPDPDADPAALRALEGLAARNPNLVLQRLGDTHAKILVCDDRFAVVGSFNWLSFRGDPDRTYRDERSVMIRTKQAARVIFDREINRFAAAAAAQAQPAQQMLEAKSPTPRRPPPKTPGRARFRRPWRP